MNTTIKMPRMISELGNLAQELGMNAPDLMGELERALGGDWINQGSFSVTTPGVQDDGQVIPPAGYELVAGCTDIYVGAETVSSAFVIRPSWHAVTGLFSIEVTPADGLGDLQVLAPDEALKLGADISAVVGSIRPVNIAAADSVTV